ncbi:MAG: Flp family type IVb pilin [Anaerolineales bacterium]
MNRSEFGATKIEYGLIAALIAVVIITGLTALGGNISDKFNRVAETVAVADPGAEPSETPSPTVLVTETSAPVTRSETPSVEPISSSATVREDSLCWRGPGLSYEVVSALEAGNEVEIVGQAMLSGWWVIDNPTYPGVLCWAQSEALELPTSFQPPDTTYAVPPLPTSTPENPKKMGCVVNGECQVPCPGDPAQYGGVCYD